MALISNLPVADVATLVARALEDLLGHDVVLSTGEPELGDPTDDMLPEGPTRTIVLPFGEGVIGELSLVVGESFATAMEAATADASLTSAAVPTLDAGAGAISFTIGVGVNVADAGEIATDTLLTSVVGEFAAVPILENDTPVACVVIRVVDDEPGSVPVPAAAPTATAGAPSPSQPAPVTPAPPILSPSTAGTINHPFAPEAVGAPSAGLALHEFQPLHDGMGGGGGGQPRPLTLLNDVHMEVTAELGRRRLKVRDIVGLQPGSVIELDRAAGSPVDVLVNGALVWHGEVVVVDEEFGIRVAEIVVGEN
jgi:flagellar motor switch protein FliN